MSVTAMGAYGGQGRRVLVCDDERHIVRLLQINLERLGYTVTCAFDGDEAVKLLEDSEFDQLILDVMMPRMDGFEVLKWIRTHEQTRHLWVTLMTAKAQDRILFQGYLYQPDRYLAKPFKPQDLFQ